MDDPESLRQQAIAVENARNLIQQHGARKLGMREGEVRHLVRMLCDAVETLDEVRDYPPCFSVGDSD